MASWKNFSLPQFVKEKKSLPQDLIPFYALHSPPNQQLGEVGLGVLAASIILYYTNKILKNPWLQEY